MEGAKTPQRTYNSLQTSLPTATTPAGVASIPAGVKYSYKVNYV